MSRSSRRPPVPRGGRVHHEPGDRRAVRRVTARHLGGRHAARDRRELGQRERVHRPAGRARRHGDGEAAARARRRTPYEVGVASTGVIGVPLPMDRIAPAIGRITLSEAGWDDASRAIMTTDTRPKVAQREVALSGGDGPHRRDREGRRDDPSEHGDAARFVATDAASTPGARRRLLAARPATSFNAISVDGDTSTNDTLLVLANGASGVRPRRPTARVRGALRCGLPRSGADDRGRRRRRDEGLRGARHRCRVRRRRAARPRGRSRPRTS